MLSYTLGSLNSYGNDTSSCINSRQSLCISSTAIPKVSFLRKPIASHSTPLLDIIGEPVIETVDTYLSIISSNTIKAPACTPNDLTIPVNGSI